MKNLVLASQSPRRSELLLKFGFSFTIYPVYVSEIPDKNLSLDHQILKIAEEKALACLNELGDKGLDCLILAADTMVCIDQRPIGKPLNRNDAIATLRLLSGRSHEVKTALFLVEVSTNTRVSHIETTSVHFRDLSDSEIQSYVETGEPMDKAGSYAIQSGARNFVAKINGDFDNVVGLPMQKLVSLLKENKWDITKL